MSGEKAAMPSERAMKAARDYFGYCDPTYPVSSNPAVIELAALLDQFAAEARLEEAKWWHNSDCDSTDEVVVRRQRIAELTRLSSPEHSEGGSK